ncbi:MAG: DEAD/DEAH box helicase family protein, partial [Bacteroidota bacterium]
ATGKKTIGEKITVAMIQSLKKVAADEKYNAAFGTIIVDECHHIPAKTFRETITFFSSYYLYGVTATPKRKNNDEKLIFVYIGKVIAEINANQVSQLSSELKLITRKTNLNIPFNYQTDVYEIVSNVLVFDTARNQLIFNDAKKVVEDGKTILLLSERKSHLQVLNLYLKERFETIVISGEDSERSRKSKLEQIEMGHFQIVLSTGQFLGEGVDIPNFHCLFLVYPFSFEGKLVQYIGRVHRSKNVPVVVDYRDEKVAYFEKLFKRRNTYYNRLRKQGRLTDLN